LAASEQYGVDLQLQIDAFEANIKKAQQNLLDVEKTAAEVSKKSSQDINQIGSESATGGVSRLTSALGGLAKVAAVGGGLILGLKLFRTVIGAVSGDDEKATRSFLNLTRGMSTAVGSAAGMVRAFAGTTGPFDAFLGRVQRATVNTTVFSGALNSLRGNDSVKSFAQNFVTNFDRIEKSVKQSLLAIPGVTPSLNFLGKAFNAVTKETAAFFNNLAANGNAIGKIAVALGNMATGAVSVAPGMNKLSGVAGLADDAAVGLAKGMQSAGIEAGALSAVGTGLIATITALNAAIAIAGSLMSGIGKSIVATTSEWAIASGKLDLAITQLTAQLESASAATGIFLGTADEMTTFLKELSKETGLADTQLVQLASSFLQVEGTAQLSKEQLQEVIKRTAILGASMGDLEGVAGKVIGGFQGFTRGLSLFLGLGARSSELTKLEADGLQLVSGAAQGQVDSLKRAAFAQQLYGTFVNGTNARVKAYAASSDNLVLALQRLQGAQSNIAEAFGKASGTFLVPLVNAFTKIINVVTDLPPGLRSVISEVINLTGVVLVAIGTVLKYASIFVLLKNSVAIFNAALTLSLPVIGNVGVALGKLFGSFGIGGGAITSFGGLVGKLGLLIPAAFRAGENAIASFVTRGIGGLLGLSFSFSGIVGVLTKVAGGILTVGLNLGKYLVFPSHLTLLIVAFKALYDAIRIVDVQIGISAAAIEFYKNNIEGSTLLTDIFTFAVAKLSQAIQLLSFTIAFALEAALLGIVAPVNIVLSGLTLLAKGLDTVFGTSLTKTIEPINEAATVLQDRLVKGMHDSAVASVEAAGRLFSMDTSLGKVKKSSEAAAIAMKKVSVSAEVLRAIFDIANKGLEETAKGIQSNADQNVATLDRLAEAQKTFVNEFISDEGYRASRVFEIENTLRKRRLDVAEQTQTELLAVAATAQAQQLAAIGHLADASDQKQEDRIKKEAEVRQKFLETETQITTDFRAKLLEQLAAVREQQNQRVQIIRDTRSRIKDIETASANAISDIQLRLLSGERANAFVREQIRLKEIQARDAASRGDFERAARTAEEINGLASKVGGPDITNALAAAARVGAAGSIKEAQAALDELTNTGHNAEKTFQDLSSAVFFARGPEDMAKIAAAAAAFQAALQKGAETTQGNEQISILERSRDLQIRIQEQRAAAAEQEKITLEAQQKAIVARLEETEAKLNELRESLSQPIETLVNFSPETSAVEAAIRELQSRNIVVPVTFQTARGVNMEGFSVHNVEDVGRLIREKFNPGIIEAGFQTATNGIAGSVGIDRFGGDGTGPSKHVRVDLNLSGETTSVDTKDQASADALVGFAKNLQNIKKSRGNYTSPFLRI